MTRVRRLVLTVGMVCGLAAPCAATIINVNGTYQVSVVDTVDNCTANGQATLTQSGSTFTGVITLTVVSGTGCPVPFGTSASGNLTGNLTGNTITLGFATSLFGRVVFTTGTISNDGNVASGTWTQTGGSAGGAWSAIRTHQAAAPALSAWSLAGLALLLAWFGITGRSELGSGYSVCGVARAAATLSVAAGAIAVVGRVGASPYTINSGRAAGSRTMIGATLPQSAPRCDHAGEDSHRDCPRRESLRPPDVRQQDQT